MPFRTSLPFAIVAALGLSATAPLALAEPPLGDQAERSLQATGDYITDSALTAQVKTALIAETDLESMKIEVESTDGVVTLSGEVPDQASITLASVVAKRVDGVREVHNKLELREQS